MNILIVTHHELLRTGLDALLRTEKAQSTLPGPHEFFLAANTNEAGDICKPHPIGLAIVDLDMLEVDWPARFAELRDALPEGTPLAAFYGGEDPRMVATAYSTGVMGVLPKSLPNPLLIRALGLIAEGGTYVPDLALRVSAPKAAAGAKPSLTRQQFRVWQMIASAMSNKEIARELNICEGTVKLHVAAIVKSTGARNRVDAAMRAAERGLAPYQPKSAHCASHLETTTQYWKQKRGTCCETQQPA